MCQSIFPKKPNKEIQKEIDNIKEEMIALKTLEPGHDRRNREIALGNVCKRLQKQHQTKGLRIDVQIKDPTTMEEHWIDVTCVHPTCKTRIAKEMKYIRSKIEDQKLRRQRGKSDITVETYGAAVRNQIKSKHQTYTP